MLVRGRLGMRITMGGLSGEGDVVWFGGIMGVRLNTMKIR
jgi:hypothetical protein